MTVHLRLDLDPERITDDKRRAATDKLRRALGLLEKAAKPNGCQRACLLVALSGHRLVRCTVCF